MSISIRTAVPDDCFAIAEIIKDSMGYDNSPAIIKKNLEKLSNKDSDIILIAEYNNQPVGFIHAEDYNSLYSEVLKDIISLAVKEKYQHLKRAIWLKLKEQLQPEISQKEQLVSSADTSMKKKVT